MKHKRKAFYPTKPASTAPSYLSSSRTNSGHDDSAGRVSTVNERLAQLRHVNLPFGHASNIFSSLAATPSLPPSISSILQIADALPPRPLPGMQLHNSSGRPPRRRPPGPAPPESWVRSADHNDDGEKGSDRHWKTKDSSIEFRLMEGCVDAVHGQVRALSDDPIFGGTGAMLPELPRRGSLQDVCLRAFTARFRQQVYYEYYNLALIPARLKELMCFYVAQLSPREEKLNIQAIKTLFANDCEIDGGNGGDGVRTLCLGNGTVGGRLTLRSLKSFLAPVKQQQESVQDAWDDESLLTGDVETTQSSSRLFNQTISRFSNLSYLCLDSPAAISSSLWVSLLSMAPYIQTVTHLCLGGWKSPDGCSRSNGDVYPFGPLSKRLYCLKWLCLRGCGNWTSDALFNRGVQWTGGWSGLEIVVLDPPEELEENVTVRENPSAFRIQAAFVRQLRRNKGVGSHFSILA